MAKATPGKVRTVISRDEPFLSARRRRDARTRENSQLTRRVVARVHFSTSIGTRLHEETPTGNVETLTGGLPSDLSDFLAKLTCNFHGNFRRLPIPFTPMRYFPPPPQQFFTKVAKSFRKRTFDRFTTL